MQVLLDLGILIGQDSVVDSSQSQRYAGGCLLLTLTCLGVLKALLSMMSMMVF